MRDFRSCLIVAALVVTGCTSGSASPTTRATSTSVTVTPSKSATASSGSSPEPLGWASCTDPAATDPTLTCATLKVPLDYAKPGGTTIALALVKYPASGKRKGAVLFNPGGPGGSGFQYIASGGATVSSSLGLTDFDLIGFDPRGVDRSGGIRCLSDTEQDTYAYLDDTPDTPAEQQLLDDAQTAFAKACATKYGDTLQYYSTANTARDMDAIRSAIGDDTISYLGVSYGTYLGAVYASLFPQRVRAMVLDSAFEPSGDTIEQQYTTQLGGFEHALDDWITYCQSDSTCEFHSDDVGAAWDTLRQQLDDHPLTAKDGRIGNQAVLEQATEQSLYSKSDWPVLGSALTQAAKGDPAGLFRLADSYSQRDANGHYSTIQQSNAIISCASGIESETPADPAALAAKLRALAPRLGKTITAKELAKGDGCRELMPAQKIDTLTYAGSAPVVVIGGKNDPATPFRWAEETVKHMGTDATLVTYTGEGHGQLLVSSCVTNIEAKVLTDLELPKAGTVCDPDPVVAKPKWWDSILVPAGIDGIVDDPTLVGALGLEPTTAYSEVRTSSFDVPTVLTAYEAELEKVHFTFKGARDPIPGSKQSVYDAPNGDLFSVFVLGADAFKDPSLQPAADLLPKGKVLVLLLYVPK